MSTNYHDRIRDSIDRYGKRQHTPKRNREKATDKAGWQQQEFDLASDMEYPPRPEP